MILTSFHKKNPPKHKASADRSASEVYAKRSKPAPRKSLRIFFRISDLRCRREADAFLLYRADGVRGHPAKPRGVLPRLFRGSCRAGHDGMLPAGPDEPLADLPLILGGERVQLFQVFRPHPFFRKEIEREKVVYDSVETILSRLDKSETEYVKAYSELVKMLGEE